MKIDIYINGREYKAYATYENGVVRVHKGSQLHFPISSSFKVNNIALEKRESEDYVKNGIVIQECCFNSPSTAAQFITGGSKNGYDTWKVKKGVTLGDYLEKKGVRFRRENKKRKAE